MLNLIRGLVDPYYKEVHRFYHTKQHIDAMLVGYKKYFGEISVPEYLAVLYHDVVYLPWGRNNEQDSIAMLHLHHAQFFPDDISLKDIQTASDIISCTRHGSNTILESSDLSDKIVDLDLMILGREKDVYDAYVQNVRKEYKGFSDLDWNKGRKVFLELILEENEIFKTDIMRNAFHKQAIDNLRRELDSLE